MGYELSEHTAPYGEQQKQQKQQRIILNKEQLQSLKLGNGVELTQDMIQDMIVESEVKE